MLRKTESDLYSSSLPRRRFPGVIAGLLVIIGGLTYATLSGTGSTLALWNGAAPIPEQQITSGSFGLEISAGQAYAESTELPAGDTNLFPGREETFDFSLANTGTTTANLTGHLDESVNAGNHLNVGVSAGKCSLRNPVLPLSGIWALASPGSHSDFCLHVELDENVPDSVQGSNIGFSIVIEATQEVLTK